MQDYSRIRRFHGFVDTMDRYNVRFRKQSLEEARPVVIDGLGSHTAIK